MGMDITKAKASLVAAQTSVKDLVDAEIKARSFNGLRALAGVDTLLAKSLEKLESAVKRTAPRAKKDKKAKKAA